MSVFLTNDIGRCAGVSSTEDGVTYWREGCEDCLRRTAPRNGIGPFIAPPAVIAFECEHRIGPEGKA
jgi:hypothetical protein